MNLLSLVFCWFVGLFLMWRIPTVPQRSTGAAEPRRVSVIIPARNEALTLPRLLRSLSRQTLPPQEILVVDDDSEDRTAAVAAAQGATVISGGRPAPGWMGKPWACWLGAQKASGDLLLFLDADTWLEPTALADLASLHEQRGGLVTVQPYHVARRPYEQLSAFFNIVLMAGLNAFTALGDRLRPGGGFGPCVLCRSADYFAVGGHQSVRGAVLEDLALARCFSSRGHRLSCYGGRGTISFRMYPGGRLSLLEGWTKNFALGSTRINKAALALTLIWVCGCFGSAFDPLLRSAATHPPLLAAYALIYVAFAAQIGWILRRIGRFRLWTAALFPLPLTYFGAVMLASVFLKVFVHRAVWKGRVVPLGGD